MFEREPQISNPNAADSIVLEFEHFESKNGEMISVFIPKQSINGISQENPFVDKQHSLLGSLSVTLQKKDLQFLIDYQVVFMEDPCAAENGDCDVECEPTDSAAFDINSLYAVDYGYFMEAVSYAPIDREKAGLFLSAYVQSIMPYPEYLQNKDQLDYLFPRVLIPRSNA